MISVEFCSRIENCVMFNLFQITNPTITTIVYFVNFKNSKGFNIVQICNGTEINISKSMLNSN
ncbi:hypothetical protein DERP_014138 [Dermatophagoides pteronyssinus]|uniref:Uncharacterized protein n=1 Tax=Dermatophagoides pteronyssinus TaxID=6956 RepID=A0ABQ8IXE1_DERPT|nr:hypothetical protein DERP_014138 [Dermatophagoides pteronyssinus]